MPEQLTLSAARRELHVARLRLAVAKAVEQRTPSGCVRVSDPGRPVWRRAVIAQMEAAAVVDAAETRLELLSEEAS